MLATVRCFAQQSMPDLQYVQADPTLLPYPESMSHLKSAKACCPAGLQRVTCHTLLLQCSIPCACILVAAQLLLCFALVASLVHAGAMQHLQERSSFGGPLTGLLQGT